MSNLNLLTEVINLEKRGNDNFCITGIDKMWEKGPAAFKRFG